MDLTNPELMKPQKGAKVTKNKNDTYG